MFRSGRTTLTGSTLPPLRHLRPWSYPRPVKGLTGRRYKQDMSATSNGVSDGNQYMSLETQNVDIDDRRVRQLALVDEQEQVLVDLSVAREAKEEASVEDGISDSGTEIVSMNQASEAMRSHLTSDVVFVSLSPSQVPSMFGLEEGTNYGSHLSLSKAFTVRCEQCQSVKIPSRKLLKDVGTTLLEVIPSEELSEVANNAMLTLKMFKYYQEIKDDVQSWEAMTHRLLVDEAPTPTTSVSVEREQIEESKASNMKVVEDQAMKLKASPRSHGSEGKGAMRSRRRQSDRPLFSIDSEFVLVKGGHLTVGQVALVNEQGGVLLNAYIKQRKPVIKYATAVNGLTKEILETKGTSFFKAVAALKRRLPTNAVLVGMGIHQDIQKLTLKQGVDFHSAVDLGDIFDSFVCPVCHRNRRPSLDHLSVALLGTKVDGSAHDAANDAARSIGIYKRYLRVKDDPNAVKELKQKIANTPKPPALKGGLSDRGGD